MMKRSEINHLIKEAMVFFTSQQFYLPPWAYFSPKQWEQAGGEYQEIRDNCLGWDITDYGKGNFLNEGLTLFTIRGGANPKYPKPYCEKVMMLHLNQTVPMHLHRAKTKDIINRGGGDLILELWKADTAEKQTNESFTVQIDGVTTPIKGGDKITLTPGEGITLEPYIYHCFSAKKEPALIGEVSVVNNNANDIRFYVPLGQLSKIEEDEPPIYLLCNEYPK